MGGITVKLCNNANVCEEFLDNIFSKSGLDNRKLSVTLDDKNDDLCVRKGLRAYAEPSRPFGQNLFPSRGDAVVYVPKITTDKWKDYKPYFAFVLGHELEHVKVIRENIKFHICATWLFDWNADIFMKAGIDYKSMKTWSFPLELHCNKKGKELATDLFGKEEFCNCFNSLRADEMETPKHKEYLTFVMDKLEGEPYTKHIWQSICHNIRENYYYNKELKTAAHEIWKDQKSNGDEIAEQFDINEFLPLD